MLVGLCVSGGVRLALERLGQIQKAATGPFPELVIGADQIACLLASEQLAIFASRLRLIDAREPVIEITHGHLESLGQLPEARSRDAVGAALVLLDLLKADPNGAGKHLLRNPNKVATPAKTLAEVNVDLVAHDGTLSKKTP